MTSPIAEALSSALKVFHRGASGRGAPFVGGNYLILSYQNPQDFNFLWNFWEDEIRDSGGGPGNLTAPNGELIKYLCSGTEPKNLFIVWDGVPKPSIVGNVYLGAYVTPYDWLIALALSLRDYQAALGAVRLRVYIIVLVSGRDGTWESAQLFRQLLDGSKPFLPWVRVYWPSDGALTGRCLHTLLLDTIEPELFAQGAVGDEAGTGMNPDWRILRRTWAARMLAPSNPRDRHAIANLMGPQVLLASMTLWSANYLAATSPCLAALLTLMRVLGLLPPGREKISAPWIKPEGWGRDWPAVDGLAFVLMDDMADLGWKDFIRLSLGIRQTEESEGILVASDAP